MALTDSSGSVQTQYDYSPYGITSASSPAGNDFRYTGREFEAEDLNYHRARYYDPTLGRWLSEDPIGLLGGDASFYAYVLNDPINAMDPSGFQSMPNQSDSAVYPPTYNCSFVSECVDTINDMIDGPEVIDLPDRGDDGKPRRRSPVGKIGKEVLVEAVKQGGVRTLCEYNNSCQCAGTCPDDPPWPPETDSSPVPDSDQPAQCTSQ